MAGKSPVTASDEQRAALRALAGLTVIQQSHETKGIFTGLSMFVIAIGFVFYSIRAALGGHQGQRR